MCHSFHTSKMTGAHQEQLIDHLRVLLFFIELNLFFMLWFQHTEDSRTQHLPSQHHHHLHHPEGEGSHRIHGSCPGYCRERLLQNTLGWVNHYWHTRLQKFHQDGANILWFNWRITPHLRKSPTSGSTGSWVETGSYFETLIHRWKLHLTAIPLEGWKNDHLQICPPGLQSHFERFFNKSIWCVPLILKTERKLKKDLETDGMSPMQSVH